MDSVWDSIDWEWDDHPHPDQDAVNLATKLLKATKAADIFPESAGSGRFPSVRFFWQNGRVEVEVFSNWFELHFFPEADEDERYSVSEFDDSSLATVVEKIKEGNSRSRR